MIKISAVSYLNTIPFIYGLRNSNLMNQIDLQLDYPAVCANKLVNGEVDVGLAPIVIMGDLKTHNIISDYCIGGNGPVDTVCVFSDLPIHQIDVIYLDDQSRTSIELLKVLLKEYWNITPKLIVSKVSSKVLIQDTHAALVIGDKAFDLHYKYRYVYDLSSIWKKMTGLPFIFAAWIANKSLPCEFINNFNSALSFGLDHVEDALALEGSLRSVSCKDMKEYLFNKISYKLDNEKRKGMALFLKKINQ